MACSLSMSQTEELQETRAKAADNALSTSSQLEKELTQVKYSLKSERHHCSTLQQELAQTQDNLEAEQARYASLEQELSSTRKGVQGESDKCSTIERELVEMEETAKDLQSELGTSQQSLEEAMELCSQHEALIEERNRELNSFEEKLRWVDKRIMFGVIISHESNS